MTPPAPQFLRVTNYERYQHYKDRRPPWVKFYIESLDDYVVNSQKPTTRLLAALLLLIAATHDNCIPYDPDWIANKATMKSKDVQESIETLITIGYLSLAGRKHSASKRIAKRSTSARPETEKRQRQKKKAEKETEIPKAVTRDDGTASVVEIEQVRNLIDRSLREAS